MSPQRFREPQFRGSAGNRAEPCRKIAMKLHVTCRFSVPGTDRNRPVHNGSRFLPSLEGNRDQCQLSGVSR
jgi:hypothetical protein